MPAHNPHRLQVDPIERAQRPGLFRVGARCGEIASGRDQESAEADNDPGFLQANFAAESVALIGVRPPGDRPGDAS